MRCPGSTQPHGLLKNKPGRDGNLSKKKPKSACLYLITQPSSALGVKAQLEVHSSEATLWNMLLFTQPSPSQMFLNPYPKTFKHHQQGRNKPRNEACILLSGSKIEKGIENVTHVPIYIKGLRGSISEKTNAMNWIMFIKKENTVVPSSVSRSDLLKRLITFRN